MSLELSAVILTDILFIELNRRNVLQSEKLKQWYMEYGLSAVIADCAIIWLVFYGTKMYTKYKGTRLLLAILAVQIFHDLAFYAAFSAVPRGVSKTMDFFKDYAREIGHKAIIGDSMMMICAFLLHGFLARYAKRTKDRLMVLAGSVYLVPYVLHG